MKSREILSADISATAAVLRTAYVDYEAARANYLTARDNYVIATDDYNAARDAIKDSP